MAGVSDIAGILTNAVQAVNGLNTAIREIRSIYVTGTAGSATGGAATLPANPVGFIETTLPDGTAVRIPYYAA